MWVINDDYILSRYKDTVTHNEASQTTQPNQYWRTRPNTIREQNLLRAVQELPIYDQIADTFKLDILLEDYLQEVRFDNLLIYCLDVTLPIFLWE